MSIKRSKHILPGTAWRDRILELEASSATVEKPLARAVGREPARIAKTMSFSDGRRSNS